MHLQRAGHAIGVSAPRLRWWRVRPSALSGKRPQGPPRGRCRHARSRPLPRAGQGCCRHPCKASARRPGWRAGKRPSVSRYDNRAGTRSESTCSSAAVWRYCSSLRRSSRAASSLRFRLREMASSSPHTVSSQGEKRYLALHVPHIFCKRSRERGQSSASEVQGGGA